MSPPSDIPPGPSPSLARAFSLFSPMDSPPSPIGVYFSGHPQRRCSPVVCLSVSRLTSSRLIANPGFLPNVLMLESLACPICVSSSTWEWVWVGGRLVGDGTPLMILSSLSIISEFLVNNIGFPRVYLSLPPPPSPFSN